MSYKFLSTIQAISATFTGNSVYSNGTPNRTVKVDAIGLYLSRTSDGTYPSSISADGSMYYDTRNSHIFRNDGTASMTLFDNTRNVGIGTSTDSGYKLDVNGTSRVVGVATFNNNINQTSGSATFGNGLLLDSTSRIFSGNTIIYQSNNAASQHYFKNDISSGLSGTLVTIGNGSGAFGTTSASNFLNISGRLATASGTNNLTSILLNHTVENTGTYTGTIRGIYYNPSSIVGTGFTHRAIETTTGDVIFNSTSGSVGIGTTSPAYKLQVAGDIGFTAGANRYIRLANPAASGSANHIIIQGASANTSGTGGNIYLYEGSGAGGPGPGSIYIGATTGWTTTYITGQATISSTGPTTGTVFQVNAGGQNGLTINWDNSTPYMGYGLVVNRQSRFYNSSSYSFDNNLIIGSNTNAGYKLDVNGTTRINSTLSLTNSTYAGTFSFYLSAANVFQASSSNVGVWLQVGGGNRVYIIGQEFNSTARGNIFGNTVGGEAISATTIIAQSSGTTATTGLSLRYTINNTGTYVGISRGIYYNPTITSLTGTTHRAIETVTGDVIFGSTSGVVGIGTTSLSTEANLYLGAKSTIEGGQLVLQKGTSQTYATHLDNYNDQFRVMVGTDTGSTAAQLIVMHATGNVLINSGIDNGYKLQVAGDVNVNTGSTTNNLVVNADTSMFYNLTSGGGQVKSNVYTTSVTTRYYVPPLSTEYLFEWDPTLCQGIFVDYVLMIQGPNFIRSGTLVIANDNGGNVTITDNINSSVNGSSTAFVTFSTAGLASIKLGCNNLLAANDVYVNIVTRYIPNIY